MKKINLFLAVSFMLLFGVTLLLAQNQNRKKIDDRWKQVEYYEKKSLPESALKEVEKIMNQAKKDNNSPQYIKALLYKAKFILSKDEDKAPIYISEFEKEAELIEKPSDKAILYAMVAQLYHDFYKRNQWKIDQRSELKGYESEDLNEWTKNQFVQKIITSLDHSLQHPEELKKTEASVYDAIIEKGETGREMFSTLYDLLLLKEIELLKDFRNYSLETEVSGNKNIEKKLLNTYDDLIDFQKEKNNLSSQLYAELEKLELEENKQSDEYLEKINQLEKQYDGNAAVVEVLAKKAIYYLSKENQLDPKDDAKKRAYEIVTQGIKRYPNYFRINLLQNIKNQILTKTMTVENMQAVQPNSTLNFKIKSENVDEVVFSVYKVDATAVQYNEFTYNKQNAKTLYPKRHKVETRTIKIDKGNLFKTHETEFDVMVGDFGIYEYTLQDVDKKENKVYGSFVATDFALLEQSDYQSKSSDAIVVNRVSGEPLNDIKAKLYRNKWNNRKYIVNRIGDYVSDKNGFLHIQKQKDAYNSFMSLEKGRDKFFTSGIALSYSEYNQISNDEKKIALFTDRSLYRPGQIVYFKGIVYQNKKQSIITDERVKVELIDANRKKISEKELKSNEFGSFAGEYILPQSGLNGAYTLRVGNNSITIWVEEYKRPTFDVVVDKPMTEVRFGEPVSLKGKAKAYAGYGLQEAKVTYRVVRRPHRFWWWISSSIQDEIVDKGVVTTDANGEFKITFTPYKSKKQINDVWMKDNSQYYTYTVIAEVTDQKGETQSGEQYVSVGDKSLFILTTIPRLIEKSKPFELEVLTQTLNGETKHTDVAYEIVGLNTDEKYYEEWNDKTEFAEAGVVLKGSFNTKDSLKLNLKKLKPQAYKIRFTAKDNRNNSVKFEGRFLLYDKNENKPPVKMYTWLQTENTELEVGEKATIHFGTSTKNTWVLYEISQGRNLLNREWIKYDNEIKNFEIPFVEKYGAGVTVTFTFVKNEKIFTKQIQLTKKVKEKKLLPSVSVFRDKLKPGEKAEWTFYVPQNDSTLQAEMLMTMYDASLDAIRPHTWRFNPTYRELIAYTPKWTINGVEKLRDYSYYRNDYKHIPDYDFDRINMFGLNTGAPEITTIRGFAMGSEVVMTGIIQSKNDMVSPEEMKENERDELIATREDATAINSDNAELEKAGGGSKPIQVRTNFNETAFFYPQLHTDKSGKVKISFTAPESLTRWNVKMLAHTPNLYFGQNEWVAVTQKELMVQMNLPRFVRRSDQLTLVANVINLSKEALNADVKLEIINPETNEIIPLKSTDKISVALAKDENKAVEWKLDALKDYDLVIVKVLADAGKFSDGEQKYLPVLPDEVLITESLPLTVRSNETRTFHFDNFIKNLKKVDTKNFTVEFSSNPAWYAAQALPTLSQPTSENAISYLTAYYANSLASYIANANPKLKTVFEQWKNVDENALKSNLEKNKELKNMLLEETPWVTKASNETEQKRQIALLFERNQQQNIAEIYLKKLLKLQTSSGGFAWYDGLRENRYVTQEILLNIARLQKMTKEKGSEELTRATRKALAYLDDKIAEDFVLLKRCNKNYHKGQVINDLQLFYLHVRSEYPNVPIAESAKSAVAFYTAQSEKYWTNWTLYGKAMMAVVAKRNGNDLVANEILLSLTENALQSDEMGMYWSANKGRYWWYARPIKTQTAIIEAFDEVAKNEKDLDELKIWLLKQKQTQIWDSPISTVDAIYALLNYGENWLENSGQTTISIGDVTLQPQKVEAGTGYFKTTLPTNELKPDMGKIEVKSQNESGIAWGSAYWQYFQAADKVIAQGREMKISKTLFVQTIVNGKKVIQPIEQVELKKGDKIITRLVLTTDRDMEFVALKDLRAACFEPVEQRSGTEWKEGIIYYRTIKDASTQYFFDYLPKGTYVFEDELWVNNTGEFTSGITSVQCLYAPEFVTHSSGIKVSVK